MSLTLMEKTHAAADIWTFRFRSDEPLVWEAGQYVQVEIPHENPDDEGTERWFTNAAAPYEGVMQVTTRVTGSTFKQALSRLEPGDRIELKQDPEGDFTWEETDIPVVFVAGGIGVTPFHSIIKQRHHDGEPLAVTLIYGSGSDDVAFADELSEWEEKDHSLTVHRVVGEPLTVDVLTRLVPGLNDCLVYVSGPEPMVEALGEALRGAGLPDTQLKEDFFPGYTADDI
ncbi:ferredoxin--NADP reductase [Tessaracoccus sp. G1721]